MEVEGRRTADTNVSVFEIVIKGGIEQVRHLPSDRLRIKPLLKQISFMVPGFGLEEPSN